MGCHPGFSRVLAAFVVLGSLSACTRSTPGSPSAPSPNPTDIVTVKLRVYNSALGEIPSAAQTFSTASPGDGKMQIILSISDLRQAGVDSLRAAVFEEHVGVQLGRLVTTTRDGTVRFAARAGTYDVFLMSTGTAADYSFVDTRLTGTRPSMARYATMRMARAGEQILGQTAVAETDASFRFATDQFTAALHPFGLQYGRIDFVGSASAADITAAWVNPSPFPCYASYTGTNVFWTNPLWVLTSSTFFGNAACWGDRSYVPHLAGGYFVMDAVATVYLRMIAATCYLIECENGADNWIKDRYPPLSPRGLDVARYAALMDDTLR